jgi:sterol 14-demethylase
VTAASHSLPLDRAGAGPGAAPPVASGRLPWLGHLLELRRDPLRLLRRVHDECGEAGEIDLAGHRVVMFYGANAQEAFFRAPDEQLDQAAAYPFMKPIFGPGVVFDATPEQRKQAVRNRSLRDQFMRGHAEMIAAETERMLARFGDAGEFDLLDFMAELTIYTSTACLIGKEFREELDGRIYSLFYDLERGTDAIAYVNPNLPLPAFRKRDRARRELVSLIEGIFERRERAGSEAQDLFAVLRRLKDADGRPRFSTDVITGMFISMMFAGHHTTSVSASWALIELLRNPQWLHRVVQELDGLYADGRDVSYQSLREIPLLECALKESLRLHPPLILLRRYELELAQPPESYANDHSKMVVSVRQPCRVRFRRRSA